MICLDANYLIGGVTESRPESRHLITWFEIGEDFCTAAPAWYEFLCGPVTPTQIETMRAFLTEGIVPFDEPHATLAARLFNATKRPRTHRVDTHDRRHCHPAESTSRNAQHLTFQALRLPRFRVGSTPSLADE